MTKRGQRTRKIFGPRWERRILMFSDMGFRMQDAESLVRFERNSAIRRALLAGCSVYEIAKSEGISVSAAVSYLTLPISAPKILAEFNNYSYLLELYIKSKRRAAA